MLQKTGVNEAI